MSYKLIKKGIKFVVDFLHFVQGMLIFLCILMVAYWFSELARVPFIKPVAPFFEAIKNITHIFYNRTLVVGEITLDFSLFVATILVLIVVWVLKVLMENIVFYEQYYDIAHKKHKKKVEDSFNLKLQEEYLSNEQKNNKVVALIKFCAENILKDKFYTKDFGVGVEQKEKEMLFDFFEILDEDVKCRKEILNEGLLLNFENFENIDNFISSLNKIIRELKDKYYTEKWQLNFLMGVDVYAGAEEIKSKTEKIKTLNKLGFKNEIICSGAFKQRYSMLEKQKYYTQAKGFYQINGENEEIFCIKS